jgi:hypothetical protein
MLFTRKLGLHSQARWSAHIYPSRFSRQSAITSPAGTTHGITLTHKGTRTPATLISTPNTSRSRWPTATGRALKASTQVSWLAPCLSGHTFLRPNVVSDEKSKLRLSRSGCSHMIRPLALNVFRMAQDVADRQDFLYRWAAT